ncbi:threonine synthase [Paenibacillus herberti]|uniref:Threonine synthase n=2 Tax=Paenibacillus herberti TaxID=1619309 RepID=A0A229P5E9_9BACL|nr:threonine synthase [Paenibacillus herberti]OXM17516.1 threonine synthase [Paenibacillus herberti]
MNKCWLRCVKCSRQSEFQLEGRCAQCGGTLLVDYDLEKVRSTFTRNSLSQRKLSSLWRYHELLPVRHLDSAVSLGEGGTPLIRLQGLGSTPDKKQIWIKREEQNPTGSFKARGFSVSVSLLAERGITKVAVPSNGNAASALAAYAARAGIEAHVFLPSDCPPLIVEECKLYGAHATLVDGMIHDAGKVIEDRKTEQGWFNVGTLRETGRVEGKKTMGIELAEQLGWRLPDIIVYPTGGGSGIIGMWKAFHELIALGMVEGELPRFISVQEEGCQPLVDAMADAAGASKAIKCEIDHSVSPTGLRVPLPPNLDLVVSILKESRGTAISVSKDEIKSAQLTLGKQGISSSPEGAATLAGWLKLQHTTDVDSAATVVLFNTSHAMKYYPVGVSN